MKTDLAKALTHKISKVVDKNQAKVVKKLHQDAKKVIKKMAKNVKKTLTKDEKKKVAKTVAKSKKIIDKAKAKIAELEIMHKQNLEKVMGDLQALHGLECALHEGVQKTNDQAEAEKDAVRAG